RQRRGGIIGIGLEPGDDLVDVLRTDGNKNVIIATALGKAVRFHEKDVRPMGRAAKGVRGITLQPGDEVIGMVVADESKSLLTVCGNGFGKRSPVNEYRFTNRGGKGVTNIKDLDRNGKVVAIKVVDDDTEIMFISQHGIVIRVKATDISVIGRATKGVRLMRLREGDKVVDAARILQQKQHEKEIEKAGKE
ncbi:DNA gyrase subunit A, partial [Candidatus Woesearchaeota archaeon]|nr:DNA gyrase subunit A [Candidatus Woesearchaeota archaeon]